MAKTRLKFDPDNFFLENQHDSLARARFMRDEAFPLAVAAYNAAEGNVRIGKVQYRNDKVVFVNLVTPIGINVGALNMMTPGAYKMMHCAIPTAPLESSLHCSLETQNPRYLMNKLSKNSSHDARMTIADHAHKRLPERFLANTIYDFIQALMHHVNQNSLSTPKFNMYYNDPMITLMAQHFAGDIAKHEISLEMMNDFDTRYRAYLTEKTQHRESLQGALDFFTGDKWMIIDGVNGGIVMGAFSGEPVVTCIEHLIRTGEVLDYGTPERYYRPVVPFKWYESFDCVPEHIKSEAELSLLMLKAHTNSSGLFPHTENRLTVYQELGAAVLRQYGEASKLLLHK